MGGITNIEEKWGDNQWGDDLKRVAQINGAELGGCKISPKTADRVMALVFSFLWRCNGLRYK